MNAPNIGPAAPPGNAYCAIIVGAGFAGLCSGIRLKQAGIDDFIILEKSETLGGTWRDNIYPGVACDVPSSVYSFSFAPHREWSGRYPPGKEILQYMKHVASKFDLMRHIHFNHLVSEAVFSDKDGLWQVATQGKLDHVMGQFLIIGSGILTMPSYPNIPGMEDFEGELMHTAKWNDTVHLAGKKVALIGTGASAIQVAPAILDEVSSLHLFQRSAAWVLPKYVKPYSRVYRFLLERVPFVHLLQRFFEYWLKEANFIAFIRPSLMRSAESQVKSIISKQVRDTEKRRNLVPNYRMGCKRILLSNDYYKAVDNDKVTLIVDPIRRITARTICTHDGQEHQVDVIICATGFQVNAFAVHGHQGQALADTWIKTPEAYLGTTVTGFPNMFIMVGPNTGLGHNSIIYMIEAQAQYVIDAITKMRAQHLQSAMVKPEVQKQYNADIQKKLETSIWQTGGCRSWYQGKDGKNFALWPSFSFKFKMATRQCNLGDYTVVAAKPQETVNPTKDAAQNRKL